MNVCLINVDKDSSFILLFSDPLNKFDAEIFEIVEEGRFNRLYNAYKVFVALRIAVVMSNSLSSAPSHLNACYITSYYLKKKIKVLKEELPQLLRCL